MEKKTNEFLMSTYVVGFGMGFGALWEIFEYLGDTWFDLDSQRVQESIGLGKSPVADTMEDLMITLVGIAVFFIIYIIDKKRNSKLMNSIAKEIEEK